MDPFMKYPHPLTVEVQTEPRQDVVSYPDGSTATITEIPYTHGRFASSGTKYRVTFSDGLSRMPIEADEVRQYLRTRL